MKSIRPTPALLSQLATGPKVAGCRMPIHSNSTVSLCQQQLRNPPTQKRTFVSSFFKPDIQTLTATRTVPYPAAAVYDVVSDVSAYSSFVPFCRTSEVSKSSSADSNGKTWPEEAKLVVGYNEDISETFWSRVYCDGQTIVEAVSGNTETTLTPDATKHHSSRPASKEDDPARNDTVLSHLLTRWTLRPFPFKPGPTKTGHPPQEHTSQLPAKEQTEVNLTIEYQFVNPVYAAMSAAAAPKVADYMIEAFEKRVQSLLDRPSAKIGSLEGVLRPRGTTP